MEKLLDSMVIIIALVAVILQSSGVDLIDWDKPYPNFAARITPIGWIVYSFLLAAAILQIVLNVRRYNADAKKELAYQQQEAQHQQHEEEITGKLSAMDTALNGMRSAIENSGYTFDSVKGIIKPRNIQRIEEGASGIQNNAPNYGPQAGRDLHIGKERELSPSEIQEILSGVAKYISDFNLNKTIGISSSQESNGRKVVLQLFDELKKAGYTVYTGGIVWSSEPIKGIRYNYGADDKNMIIQVGIIPDPD